MRCPRRPGRRSPPVPRSAARAADGIALWWGIGWGVALASGFSALLLCAFFLLTAVRLAVPDAPPAYESLRVTRLVPAYFLGSILSGLLFGALRTGLTSAFRSVLVGVIAALPFFLTLRVLLVGLSGWTAWDSITLAGGSVAWGGVLGLLAWRTCPERGRLKTGRR